MIKLRGSTVLCFPCFYFCEWHEPLIGQFEQPHPQEDFPFFLFRTIEIIIAATIATIMSEIIIVAKF